MTHKLDELLEHAGVKGMKWGVRRTAKQLQNGSKKLGKKIAKRLDESARSSEREKSWSKIDTSKMSTQEIMKVAARAGMENDLKRLGKTKADKALYRNREKMDDQALMGKVMRLRAEKSLDRNAREATREQVENGRAVIAVAGPIIAKAAITKSVSPADFASALALVPKSKPKEPEYNFTNELLKSVAENGKEIKRKQRESSNT